MTIVRDSFYINGEWVKATSTETLEVTTSGTGELFATVPAGTVEEANLAVEAAAAAFTAWANTSPKERGEFLTRISEKLAERDDEIALIINTVEEKRTAIQDSYHIRRAALTDQIPTYTTLDGARAAANHRAHADHGEGGDADRYGDAGCREQRSEAAAQGRPHEQ